MHLGNKEDLIITLKYLKNIKSLDEFNELIRRLESDNSFKFGGVSEKTKRELEIYLRKDIEDQLEKAQSYSYNIHIIPQEIKQIIRVIHYHKQKGTDPNKTVERLKYDFLVKRLYEEICKRNIHNLLKIFRKGASIIEKKFGEDASKRFRQALSLYKKKYKTIFVAKGKTTKVIVSDNVAVAKPAGPKHLALIKKNYLILKKIGIPLVEIKGYASGKVNDSFGHPQDDLAIIYERMYPFEKGATGEPTLGALKNMIDRLEEIFWIIFKVAEHRLNIDIKGGNLGIDRLGRLKVIDVDHIEKDSSKTIAFLFNASHFAHYTSSFNRKQRDLLTEESYGLSLISIYDDLKRGKISKSEVRLRIEKLKEALLKAS